MNTIYDMLAPLYDALNQDVDYEKWTDFLCDCIKRHHGNVREILDLGCGTGSVSIALAKRGFDVVGIDRSVDMLSEAQKRAAREKADVLFLAQDMRNFELYGTVQAVVCTLDGINHLTTPRDLDRCFSLVHNYLEPGGLFIFDVNSARKFEEVYGDEVYTMQTEDAFVVWENHYSSRTGICDFNITLFQEENDGRYLRFYECQREKHYARTTLKKHLRANGFTLLDIRGDHFGEELEGSERYHLIARADK